MKNIILIGPPASGKGTQSKLLSQKYQIPHISVGALLREEASKDNETSKAIRDILEQGTLVNEDIVSDILERRLTSQDCSNGYILDGYPRSLEQVKRYEDFLTKNNIDSGYVLFIDIPREEALERVLARIMCPLCGKIFGGTSSQNLTLCDKCNTKLSKRTDDNNETFKNRFDIFLKETQPLINYYKDKGIIHMIDGSMAEEDIFMEIIRVLNN